MERQQQKKDVLLRLRRIEGQLRGLQRMVQDEAACADIMTQVVAATAAMKKAGLAIVQAHMEDCLVKSLEEPASRRGEILRDVQKAISRYIDWS